MKAAALPSSGFELAADEIAVWPVQLGGECVAEAFHPFLNEAERARAARFRASAHRGTWVQSRAALRVLLGRYLQRPAGSIEFHETGRGKPTLGASFDLNFNNSHSGSCALMAFANNQDLGVDVEMIKPMNDLSQIARRFFCPAEADELHALEQDARHDAFFRCWTRKEAYLKATGDGLYTPLDSFQVTMRSDVPARVVHIGGDEAEGNAWTVHDLTCIPGYAAAIAYRGERRTLKTMPLLHASQLLRLAQ